MNADRARGPRTVLSCAALLALVGCVPLPVGQGTAAVPPASGTNPSATSKPAKTSLNDLTAASAKPDSTPSADAQRVLATIPEPLSPSQRVPPLVAAGAAATTVTVRAPDAAYDTLRAVSDGDSADVPVPAPTQPLVESTLAMPDTLTPPASAPDSTATAAVAPAAAAAPVAAAATPTTEPAQPAAAATATPPPSGECWRGQVAAPEEQEKANSRSAAAQSLLMVDMVITYEKGLYKVRTRDCMTREAADVLRKRAVESGFDGSFLLNTGAPAPAKAKAPTTTTAKPKPATGTKKPK
jgi:hypothetical protein